MFWDIRLQAFSWLARHFRVRVSDRNQDLAANENLSPTRMSLQVTDSAEVRPGLRQI